MPDIAQYGLEDMVKRIGKHKEGCVASKDAHAGKRESVWMTPELIGERVLYVCADASSEAKLQVFTLKSVKLPKF